jgi:hypothetical protein
MFTDPMSHEGRLSGEFSPKLAAVVGHRRHLTYLGNFEDQCPSVALDPRRTAEFDIGHLPHAGSAGAPASRRPLP